MTREQFEHAIRAAGAVLGVTELLVIGSSRRHGAQMAALGPVSHDVLLNIAGPTLVVHGDTETGDTEARPEAEPAGRTK